jgi:hypothetical protein
MTEGMERLAAVIVESEAEVERAEKALADAKRQLLNYQIELAAQMDEKGVSTFTLADGSKITAVDELRVTLLKDRKKSTDALEAMGLGNILKKEVKVSLGRGADPSPLKDALRALSLPFEEKDDVPWNTLSKCLKEYEAEEGKEFDRSCFNVFEARLAKVTKSRK